MTNTRHTAKGLGNASPLQRDILKTLLYFDMFRYPLASSEIYRYLPSNSTSPDEVLRACRAEPLAGLIREDRGFFFLSDKSASSPLAERERNEDRAHRAMSIAKAMGSLICRFPFVRGVYISGELSKGVLSEKGDVDFVVVTAPGRVWVSRTLLILFKKVFLFNSKRFFCINHVVSEDFTDVSERNRYTAMELVTLKPLFNEAFLSHYLGSNRWILEFLPNVDLPRPEKAPRSCTSVFQKLLELPLRGRFGDSLDVKLMEMWKKVWRARYAHLPAEKRETLFRTERWISTAYAGDFLTRILSEYSKRLSQYHLIGTR